MEGHENDEEQVEGSGDEDGSGSMAMGMGSSVSSYGGPSGSGGNTSTSSTTNHSSDTPTTTRKRMFSKELRCMMYGFGDDENPYTESVDLIEDLVIEFISEVTHKTMDIGKPGKVIVEDILHYVRKDPRKYARVKDLLNMNEELKKARKAFDEVKYAEKALLENSESPEKPV